MQKNWKIIPSSFGRYEATVDGEIRNAISKHIMKPDYSLKYPTIRFYINSHFFTKRVHLLVAETFMGPIKKGMEVHHIDGDPTNPKLSNLMYVTHAQNLKYRDYDPHTKDKAKGDLTKKSKLTEAQRREVIKIYANEKISSRELGKRFGVAHSSILAIVQGKRYAGL